MRTFIKVTGIIFAVLFVFWTIMRVVSYGDFSGVTILVLAGIATAITIAYRSARESGKTPKFSSRSK